MKRNNKVTLVAWLLLCQVTSVAASTAIPWWEDIPTLQPYVPHQPQPTQVIRPRHIGHNGIPAIQPITFRAQAQAVPRIKTAHFRYPQTNRLPVMPGNTNCQRAYAGSLSSHCLLQASASHKGLIQTLNFLTRVNSNKVVAKNWANVSNAALVKTAKSLLHLKNGATPTLLHEQFSLRKIHSDRSGDAKYTGYFTPILNVSRTPNKEYRYPIYAKPPYPSRYTHAQIHQGALRGKGLEVAWTNDRVNLFFAQIQGSAIAHYTDGRQAYLNYAGNNYKPYRSISHYLRKKGYIKGSLSNESVRKWLHHNPHKMNEVLHHNPRYVFFQPADHIPKTSTGSTVIPGHTIAVDDSYIPLGAILLAKIPRINAQGQQAGHDWRLLFAHDRGHAIRGPGRIDLYVGAGREAEQHTYKLTGLHDTYLLMNKPVPVKNHLTDL